jgi:hypothetical protein
VLAPPPVWGIPALLRVIGFGKGTVKFSSEKVDNGVLVPVAVVQTFAPEAACPPALVK